MKKIICVSALSVLLLAGGSGLALAGDYDSDSDGDTTDDICKVLEDSTDTDELAARVKLASGLLEDSDLLDSLSDDDDALLDLGAVLRLVSEDDDDLDCD